MTNDINPEPRDLQLRSNSPATSVIAKATTVGQTGYVNDVATTTWRCCKEELMRVRKNWLAKAVSRHWSSGYRKKIAHLLRAT